MSEKIPNTANFGRVCTAPQRHVGIGIAPEGPDGARQNTRIVPSGGGLGAFGGALDPSNWWSSRFNAPVVRITWFENPDGRVIERV